MLLLLVVLIDSDAAAGVDASSAGERESVRLLMVGLKPSEQADGALLRRTTISIAQPFKGPQRRDCLCPRAEVSSAAIAVPETAAAPWMQQ